MIKKINNGWLVLAGMGAFLGGLLHIAALLGGSTWIAFFRAPKWIVESAQQGTWIAPVGSIVITGLMWLCSSMLFLARACCVPHRYFGQACFLLGLFVSIAE